MWVRFPTEFWWIFTRKVSTDKPYPSHFPFQSQLFILVLTLSSGITSPDIRRWKVAWKASPASNWARRWSTPFIGFMKRPPSELFSEISFPWSPWTPSCIGHQLRFSCFRWSARSFILWTATLSQVSTSAPSTVHWTTPFSCSNTSDSPKIARGGPRKSSTFGSQSIVCAQFSGNPRFFSPSRI